MLAGAADDAATLAQVVVGAGAAVVPATASGVVSGVGTRLTVEVEVADSAGEDHAPESQPCQPPVAASASPVTVSVTV